MHSHGSVIPSGTTGLVRFDGITQYVDLAQASETREVHRLSLTRHRRPDGPIPSARTIPPCSRQQVEVARSVRAVLPRLVARENLAVRTHSTQREWVLRFDDGA